jgi:hypothetical protein
MLRKIHGTNFFRRKFLDRTNIKSQNELVLPPVQVFYFNGQTLIIIIIKSSQLMTLLKICIFT